MNNYFSHDSNARNSDKLIPVRMKLGAEGYGIFYMILERLREEENYTSVKDYNMIAFDLRVDASKVKSIVEDFGLFVFTDDGKYFYSEGFKKRMEKKDEKRKKLSDAGKRGSQKRWDDSHPNGEDVTTLSENDNHPITTPSENDNKKRKEKESKEEEIKEKKEEEPPTPKRGVRPKKVFDLSFCQEGFKPLMEKWMKHKASKNSAYKTEMAIQTCYNDFYKKSGGDLGRAVEILNHSIGSNYQGLYAPKDEKQGYKHPSATNTNKTNRENF